ncbi:class I SAM-dependent methyltransferase [Humibacter ginsengiterrae]
MDWSDFYTAQAGRAVRPTFTAAMDAWREARGCVAGDAIDLGCGDGVESRTLVRRGWRVLALDSDPGVVERVTAGVPEGELERLTVRRASFEELAGGGLPAADVVYAGFALPFCSGDVFARLWSGIRSSLRSGGLFAGELFGPHDDFAQWPDVNTHDRVDVDRLLDGLDVLLLQEDDRDGASFAGPKHWHVFHIVARVVR